MRPIGILLAAGRGRRLGGGKMLRPLPPPDGRPLAVASLDVLAPACDVVVAVMGADAEAVLPVLAPAAVRRGMRLEAAAGRPDAPMLASIRAGLQRARAIDETAWVLLHPGDVPGTAPATVAALLAAAADEGAGGGPPSRPPRACMPTVGEGGPGGHPVLLPPAIVARVASLPDEHPGGLRALWEREPGLARRVPVDDPACRRDVDTPADLAAARPAPPAPETRPPAGPRGAARCIR